MWKVSWISGNYIYCFLYLFHLSLLSGSTIVPNMTTVPTCCQENYWHDRRQLYFIFLGLIRTCSFPLDVFFFFFFIIGKDPFLPIRINKMGQLQSSICIQKICSTGSSLHQQLWKIIVWETIGSVFLQQWMKCCGNTPWGTMNYCCSVVRNHMSLVHPFNYVVSWDAVPISYNLDLIRTGVNPHCTRGPPGLVRGDS